MIAIGKEKWPKQRKKKDQRTQIKKIPKLLLYFIHASGDIKLTSVSEWYGFLSTKFPRNFLKAKVIAQESHKEHSTQKSTTI